MKVTTESANEEALNLTLKEDEGWIEFCENQLKKFETKWTKKLEDYGGEKDKEEEEPFKFNTTPKQVADNESRRYQDASDES